MSVDYGKVHVQASTHAKVSSLGGMVCITLQGHGKKFRASTCIPNEHSTLTR